MRILEIAAVHARLHVKARLGRTIDRLGLHRLVRRWIARSATRNEGFELGGQFVPRHALRHHRAIQRAHQLGRMRTQLHPHFFLRIAAIEGRLQGLVDQRLRVFGRDEKAHQLFKTIAGDVDADHLARRIQRRAAGHAAVDRTRVMDACVERIFDPAVRHTLGDGEADIERKADGVSALALGRHHRFERHRRWRKALRLDHGEVVQHVDGQHRDLAGAPLGCVVLEAVLLGKLHLLGDDVIVGQQHAVGGDREASAMESLRGVGTEEALDLHDGGAHTRQHIAGVFGEWLGSGFGGGGARLCVQRRCREATQRQDDG